MTAERHALYLLPPSEVFLRGIADRGEGTSSGPPLPYSISLRIPHSSNAASAMPRYTGSRSHVVSWKICSHSIASSGSSMRYLLTTKPPYNATGGELGRHEDDEAFSRTKHADSDVESAGPRSLPPLYSPSTSVNGSYASSDSLDTYSQATTVTPTSQQRQMESIITAHVIHSSDLAKQAQRLTPPNRYRPQDPERPDALHGQRKSSFEPSPSISSRSESYSSSHRTSTATSSRATASLCSAEDSAQSQSLASTPNSPMASPALSLDTFEVDQNNSALLALTDLGEYLDNALRDLGLFRRARLDFVAVSLARKRFAGLDKGCLNFLQEEKQA